MHGEFIDLKCKFVVSVCIHCYSPEKRG